MAAFRKFNRKLYFSSSECELVESAVAEALIIEMETGGSQRTYWGRSGQQFVCHRLSPWSSLHLMLETSCHCPTDQFCPVIDQTLSLLGLVLRFTLILLSLWISWQDFCKLSEMFTFGSWRSWRVLSCLQTPFETWVCSEFNSADTKSPTSRTVPKLNLTGYA